MRDEVCCAANFVAELLSTGVECMDEEQVEMFTTDLTHRLMEHYKCHWHPEKPTKGSGYRCLRINHQADPIIQCAADHASLTSELHRLPAELTIWVDPREVSYRIGEDGSVCNLLKRAAPPSTSISPNAESWYPASRSPPSPSVSPPRQSTSPNYSYSPVNFEVRRSPLTRRLSQPDSTPWNRQGASLSWLNATTSSSNSNNYNSEYTRHVSYRQQSYPSPPESPPTITSSHHHHHHQFLARSPSPPYRSSRMARFVATPVS
eukprot:scpid5716/ scgid15023/ Protein BTG1; B-cell translocation gene 1 protein